MVMGESRTINLSARAFPAVHSYVWSRDVSAGAASRSGGDVTVASDGGALPLRTVKREHAGWYRLEAINELGSATARVHLDVLCKELPGSVFLFLSLVKLVF